VTHLRRPVVYEHAHTIYSLAAGDYDGDTYIDLVAGHGRMHSLPFVGQGGGAFAAPALIESGYNPRFVIATISTANAYPVSGDADCSYSKIDCSSTMASAIFRPVITRRLID
jgi:hypothetical protein